MPTKPTHLKHLISDPKNRRKHTPRNLGQIVEALHKVGAARSIVIDEKGEVLAGNATVEAAAEAGLTKVKVVDATGSEVVAVRRIGLTDDQKRDLALFDNRAAELAEWDIEQLMEDVKDGLDLDKFFHPDELRSMFDAAEQVDLDKFFEAVPDADGSNTVTLVLKFSPDQHRDVLKALESHGKSPEQGVLNVLGIT
jgi:hypothetical protein